MSRLQVSSLYSWCVFLMVICLFSPVFANAQSAQYATIVGQVVDQQNAVVPNATVTATNPATGFTRTAKTTSDGSYTISNLPPGTYIVKVDASSGLKPGEVKDFKLNVGDQRDLNFKLAVAGSQQTIEITSQAPLIETTKTDVSTSVTDLDMERLPTFAGIGGVANDYAGLALTAPGVKLDTSSLTGDLIGPGSINNRANLYNVDGANITDQLVSGRDGLGASVDEIQEFQVITNNYNAEYGQAGGLIINAVTKSGTNGVHGEGHMYFRGRNMRASDPFYNIFVFQHAVPVGTVGPLGAPHCPATDFVGGTLTKLDGCDRAPFHRKEGGFTIGGPFVKNHLFWFASFENSRQSIPQVLTPPSGAIVVQEPVNNFLYSGKVDYKINDKHTLTARMWVDRQLFDNLIVQTGNNITPNSLTGLNFHVFGYNIGFVSALSPNLVNEARFAFVRQINALPDKTAAPGVQGPTFYTGAAFCCPQGGLQKRYQFIDNLTWTHGKHTFKTGFNISYYPWYSLFQQFHFGQYTVTAANVPTSFTFAIGPGAVTSKDNIYGFYFQDTWKLTRKLTMNAGLRYDYEAGAFKGGKLPGPGGTCFQGNGIIPACSSDKNNWQPRLGFTYAPWERTLFKLSFAESTVLAFNNVVLDSLNFDGTTLNTINTTDPLVLAAFPNAPSPALLSGSAACPPSCGRVRPISNHLKNPEIRSVNFGIQHEFTKTLSAEIQYIGQFGFGLFGERDTNAAPVIADPTHPGFFYFGQRPDSRFTAIRTNENSRTSHYNGLLVSVNKRFSNHVQFLASYTWSHAITSGEDFFGLSEPGDPRNIRAELGPAFNDIRHAANMGVILDSGKLTQTNVLRWFTNDVGLSWIGQLQSGRPYPISTGTAGFKSNGRFFGAGNETQQRPNVLADGTLSTAGIASFDGANVLFGPTAVAQCNASLLFTAAQCASIQNAFAPPAGVTFTGAIDAMTGAPVVFQFVNGSLGRDAGRGSPFVKFDVSLKKMFKIPRTEHVSFEIRADAINVFNHSNWQGFNSNDSLSTLVLSTTGSPSATNMPNADFFTCLNCVRPNGTLAGTTGQILHLADVQRGKLSSDLTNPLFGAFGSSIGDPALNDTPRQFQFSFHVRF
jgi:Carboxypeptidase regulatory-like domain/TonB dependent receptor